eukprot:10590464-Alexandrium_andersonii.AAC.1
MSAQKGLILPDKSPGPLLWLNIAMIDRVPHRSHDAVHLAWQSGHFPLLARLLHEGEGRRRRSPNRPEGGLQTWGAPDEPGL